MAQTELLERYLDAGVAFTRTIQQRAEALAEDLVRAGEAQAERATARGNELLERSRQNTERLVEMVRSEVREQIRNLGVAGQSDIDVLREEIASLKTSTAAKKAPAAKPGVQGGGPRRKAAGATKKG